MQRHRVRLALAATAALVVQVVLGLLLARIYLTSQNTLQNNGRWISTKTTMARALFGAHSFVQGRQALARGNLDLSAWHGHQEVLAAEETSLLRVELDFRLDPGAWITVIVDQPNRGPATALRLSTLLKYPNAFLKMDALGEFSRKKVLRPRKVEAERWSRLVLEYSEASFRAILDDHELGDFPLPPREVRRFGMRGSPKPTLVDRVVLASGEHNVLRDDFDGPQGSRRLTAWIVGGVIAVNILAVLGLSILGRRRRQAGFAYVMISVTLVIVAAMVLGFLYFRGRTYPFAGELEGEERRTRQEEIARIRTQVTRQHTPQAEADTHRILVLGSSQTWGSGAAKHRHVWVSVLESLLNADPGLSGRFETINAGIASAKSFHLTKALEEEWLALGPRTVIVNLGTNDRDLEAFRANIDRILEVSAESGARTLVILEANSPEHWDGPLKEKHAIMREIAEARGVPVLDMHAYLDTRKDDGFLWWDSVHLTSFGQRLLAERLRDELLELGFFDPAPAESP